MAGRFYADGGISGWGCPNELRGQCMRMQGRACDPGMKGCVLHGRFVFSNPEKNRPPTRTVLPPRDEPAAGDTAPTPRPPGND